MSLLKRIWPLALVASPGVGILTAELVGDALAGAVAGVGVLLSFVVASWEREPFVGPRQGPGRVNVARAAFAALGAVGARPVVCGAGAGTALEFGLDELRDGELRDRLRVGGERRHLHRRPGWGEPG